MQVNRELHELACLAKRSPALQQQLREKGGKAVWESGQLGGFADFASRFRRFLEDHGHREMDMDHYHPTWSGQPWIVLDAIALILRNDAAEEPAELARRQRLRHSETEQRFLAIVPEDLRFFFRELIRLARTYTTLDDLEHYQTSRLNPVCRQLLIGLGTCLKERGILDRPDDVFFLRKAELAECIAAEASVARDIYRRKVQEAKKQYEASIGKPLRGRLSKPPRMAAQNRPAGCPGLPGSPGRVTGPCFLIRSADDFARFPRQAILVARTDKSCLDSPVLQRRRSDHRERRTSIARRRRGKGDAIAGRHVRSRRNGLFAQTAKLSPWTAARES